MITIERIFTEAPWLSTLSEQVWTWFSPLRIREQPGWVRFCHKGALLKPGPRAGLGISCLSLRLCAILGLLPRIPGDEFAQWIQYIQSFQQREGRFVGFFEDRSIFGIADRFLPNIPVRRAESRQAYATLLSVGASPLQPVTQLPATPEEVRQYIHELDWTQPWGAGSHTGHLLFFYEMNGRVFGQTEAAERFIPLVLAELDRLQDPETGSWYTRRPAPHQMVNGAMKVLTGYASISKQCHYPERLIDTCLAVANEEDGCNNADIIYVLYQCSRYTNYRQEEILEYCASRVKKIERFRRHDGAFSFFENHSQTSYYGKRVSRGYCESDIHGTTMFALTLAMLGDLLGYNETLGWQVPLV